MSDGTEAWSPRLLDGRYQLGERLGGGAVADVFRGVDKRLERPVAVKVFRGDAAAQLHRHEAEMRTLASLDHPSLVSVFDAGTAEETGQPFLVMQLVEGHTLADELHEGPLTAERAATYGAALADALAYVHARGFVHRDVKPANVLIAADGRVHLADFGIARLVDSAHETRTGDVLGTPAYFAPEQVAGEPVAAPADVYALGIMLIEALSGERPFEGTAMEIALARVNRSPDVPTTLSQGWQTLLAAMTARNPRDRPSAGQVADNLRRLAEGGDIDRTVVMAPTPAASATTVMPATAVVTNAAAAYPATTAQARRRGPSAAVILLIVVIVAAIAVGAIVALNRNDTTGPTTFTPGKPKLHPAKVEKDMQKLEQLVHR